MYLLDTDTSIFLLNRKHPSVEQKLRSLGRDDVGLSTITVAELHYGARHSVKKEANETRVRIFASSLQVFPFDEEAAVLFGATKEDLISRGEMIGTMDLLIASVALAKEATLVTHNLREFQRIPALKCEDWL